MKNIFLFILTIISINGLAQFPVTQSMGTGLTKLQVNGGLEAKRGIINGVFPDTTAANADHIDFYNGAQIYTRSDRNFWLRDSVLNTWIRMAKFSEITGGSGTDNTNLGSFYRILVPSSQGLKGLAPGINILIDSSTNANSLTIHADTTTGFQKLATQGDIVKALEGFSSGTTLTSVGGGVDIQTGGAGNVRTLSSEFSVATNLISLTTGGIANSKLTNSTISGIALGSNLANLTATDATLTFSGTYNGSTARTIGINLSNANTWSADQSVPDEAYDATAWNGSMEVPTKNAIRDKIESMAGGSSALSSITAGVASNTINSGDNDQEWQWDGLTGKTGFLLSATTTAATGDAQALFGVLLDGANATSNETTMAAYISNEHTGTGSFNVGLSVRAISGATNYAIYSESGINKLVGNTELGEAGTLGVLKFYGSTSGVVTLQPQTTAGTYTMTLPNSNASGSLTNNGSGSLSWVVNEAAFTETAEEFAGSTSMSITLSNTPKAGKAEMYYLNGVVIVAGNVSRTGTGVTFSGFTRDNSDVITAKYSY